MLERMKNISWKDVDWKKLNYPKIALTAVFLLAMFLLGRAVGAATRRTGGWDLDRRAVSQAAMYLRRNLPNTMPTMWEAPRIR